MNKLICVDGSSLLATSFFGNLPRDYYFAKTEEERETVLKKVMQTSAGVYTNGVFTMLKMLINLINKQKPTHLAIAWDLTRDTFRKTLFSEYKGHREETKPELISQFILMQDVLRKMNIYQYADLNYEADDVIGTLAKKFKTEAQVYILTKDQDALQIVDESIRLWLITSKAKEMYNEVGINSKTLEIPDNTFEFTPDYVRYFYGLNPLQIIDKKALEGDKSDNIPGVKGVGEKVVVPLLQEFGTVEGIYEAIESQDEKSLKELFKELGIRSPLSYLTKTSNTELVGKNAAFLSKTLATIKIDIPELETVKLEELALDINIPGMLQAFKELEMNSLIEKGEALLA